MEIKEDLRPIKSIGRTQGLVRKPIINFTEDEKEIIYNEVIEQLTENPNKGLVKILKENQTYPSITHFYNWIDSTPARSRMYARTQEVKAHILFNDLLETAKGNPDTDTVCKVQRDRLITDTIKFYVAKVLPRIYGDKIDVTTNGESINIVSLGVGISPPPPPDDTMYIDVTPGPTGIGE
jgi:hypothetical protein